MNYIFPLSFWFSMLYFVLAIWLAFFIPGSVLLKKQKLYVLTHIVVSFGVGMVLWGLQCLVFGYLHIRWASYIYLAIFLAIWLKNSYPFHITSPIISFALKKNIFPILLI